MNGELIAILLVISWCVSKICNTIYNICHIKYVSDVSSKLSSSELLKIVKGDK